MVVDPPLDLAWPHGQQRLVLALFVDAKHQRALRRVETEACDVAYLVDEQQSLKVSERCGCRPKACHIRWIVDGAGSNPEHRAASLPKCGR